MSFSVTNNLLNINMITRMALRNFINSNNFLKSVRKTYDDQFAQSGWKIGSSLRIRLPNSFVAGVGPTVTLQGTNEQAVTLTVATQRYVAVSYSSADMALKLDDFGDIILRPAMNNLGAQVANDVMGSALQFCNFAANQDANGNILSPTVSTFTNAGALLDNLDAPSDGRMFIMNPLSLARAMTTMSGLFNNPSKISKQYDTGTMDGQNALGALWMKDQLVQSYTTGAYTNPINVANVSNQTGSLLQVTGGYAGLKVGDFFTIGTLGQTSGVDSVNRSSFTDTGRLCQFVVTSAPGGGNVGIYPPITPPLSGNVQQYQTVTKSPVALSNITVLTNASATYTRNFLYSPEAVEMVTADLPMPGKGVVRASREAYNGISLRNIESYIFLQDQFASRFDILYGWLTTRPEWGCVVADIT